MLLCWREPICLLSPQAGCFVLCWHPLSAGNNSLQYLGELGAHFVVYKNDEKTVDEIRAMNPAGILVSPGPGELAVLLLFVICYLLLSYDEVVSPGNDAATFHPLAGMQTTFCSTAI